MAEEFQDAVEELLQKRAETGQTQVHDCQQDVQCTDYNRVVVGAESIEQKWHKRIQAFNEFLVLVDGDAVPVLMFGSA